MLLFSRVLQGALGAVWFAAAVRAVGVEDALSFGHKGSLSPDLRSVSGWKLEGEGSTMPTLLSDRVILTPPWPGNRRGALWANEKVRPTEWTVDFQFRATGPERGGGNLQIWYTKSKQGTSSVYTINKFDGLALVVDTYGGRGGGIRGFLNDGNIDYKTHHSVDSLAFGHCDYSYRNLGRLTKLQLKQTANSFEVIVDDKPCFKSDKIKLPSENYFGISAASAESPDSFEAYKFVVTSVSVSSSSSNQAHGQVVQQNHGNQGSQHQQHPPQQQQQQQQQPQQVMPGDFFQDLQSHLHAMKSQLDHLQSQISELAVKSTEVKDTLARVSPAGSRIDAVNGRLSSIEGIIKTIQKDVEGSDYHARLDQLHQTMRDTHSSLLTALPVSVSQVVQAAAPRMGVFVWLVVAFQLVLVASYVVYKRRRMSAPKKYL